LKRYKDYNSYLQEIFGERVQKISLDAGLGCPNRDGTISDMGCIYCDSRGSGTGALIREGLSLDEQIIRAQERIKKRYKSRKFIAYFQSFTNTYAPLSHLKEIYDQALGHKDIVGLSVGTRPDCVDMDVLELLATYQSTYLVWVEFGLQSAHDITLERINRGHDVGSFKSSVLMARQCGLNVCAHVILGLPGEDREMMLETARFISDLPIEGVKIHLMYVVKETQLAELYQEGAFRCLDQEEYVELVVDFLELLPPSMVIQRLTSDPIRSELVAPSWAKDKSVTLGLIREALQRRNAWQGRLFRKRTAQTWK
jgi:radical SAM protein (TIGR01212 family)